MAFAHSVWGVDGVSLVESSANDPAARGTHLSTVAGFRACSRRGGVEPGVAAWEVVGFWHTVGP